MSTLYKISYWLGLLGLGLGLFIVTNYSVESATEELSLYFTGLVIVTVSLLTIIDAKIWLNHFNKEKQKEKLYDNV